MSTSDRPQAAAPAAPPSKRPAYPPDDHILRDLRFVIEREDGAVRGLLELVPELADETGRPRLGALVTLADVVAGEVSIRAALPNWCATSSLNLDVGDLPKIDSATAIAAIPRILRKTRQTVVVEVSMHGVAPDAGASHPVAVDAVGLATVGFAILPARSTVEQKGHWAEEPPRRSEFGLPGSRLEKPLLEAIGIEADSREPGRLALEGVPPFLRNSLGALQGGIVATLLEAAAEHFAAAHLARPVRVRGLAIHFLKLGRIGPIRTQTRLIGSRRSGLIVRVELFDDGADAESLSVATVQVDSAADIA